MGQNLAKSLNMISKLIAYLSNYEVTNQARNASDDNGEGGGIKYLLFSADLTPVYVTVAQDGGLAVSQEPPSGSTEHK